MPASISSFVYLVLLLSMHTQIQLLVHFEIYIEMIVKVHIIVYLRNINMSLFKNSRCKKLSARIALICTVDLPSLSIRLEAMRLNCGSHLDSETFGITRKESITFFRLDRYNAEYIQCL